MAKLLNVTLLATLAIFTILAPCFIRPCLCCPRYQKEALLQFKSLLLGNDSLFGQNLQGLQTWNHASDCCQWEHVSCNSNTVPQQVSRLSLGSIIPYLGLKHVVTSKVLTPLFHLRTLKSLDISGNAIQGEFPEIEFANLTEIVYLYMSNNSFNGSIPRLKKMEKMIDLDLSNNLFSGKIPSSIEEMQNLTSLDLSNNRLSDEIPTWLFDLRELESLILGNNNLTWKNADIAPKCINLEELSLGSCNVSGQFPIWISNLTGLSHLDFSENHLTGNLPHWLAEMSISDFIISGNMLSGSLPPHFFQVTKYTILHLSRNNFSGELPEAFSNSTLQELVLSGNNFVGPVPKSFFNISTLEWLDLSGNKLSTLELPNDPLSSPSLAFMDLSSNIFSVELPTLFPVSLSALLLGQNQLSGVLSQSLSNLSRLTFLDLHDNYVVGKIPPSLSQIASLQILNLRGNHLQGPIPVSLSNLTHLQILDLSNNNLSGNVPPSLGNLSGMINYPDDSATLADLRFAAVRWLPVFPQLEVFWKKHKQGLAGKNLQMYTLLDLSKNQLSGEISDTLGCLKGLKLLNLSLNELSGRIPSTFGSLQNLESLDLSHNNLSGEIPNTFSKLVQLGDLDLSNNKLKGPIPEGPQMDRLNDPKFYANNSGLCGMQIRIPCEKLSPEVEPRKANPDGIESWEDWFSWKMAGIVLPFALVSTVVVMYVIDYINLEP